jgi:hypothetical protein
MGVSFKGFTEIATLLLEAGAAVNVVNNGRTTALMFAAMFGQEAIVRLLLGRGADPDIRDLQGLTAMDHAKARGQEAVAILLES